MAGSVVQALVVVLTILICNETILAYPWQRSYMLRQTNYWWTRQYLLMEERQEAFGANLLLNSIETKANEILMTAKTREINDGLTFLFFFTVLLTENTHDSQSFRGHVCNNNRLNYINYVKKKIRFLNHTTIKYTFSSSSIVYDKLSETKLFW